MIDRIFRFIEPRATGRNVLIAAGVYALLSIVFRVLWAKDANGTDVVMLDTCFGYSPADVYKTIGTYGAEGRAKMLFLNRVIDSIYPFAYITFDVLFIIWLYRKSTANAVVWRRLCIIPPITFVVDFIENIPLGFAISRYPTPIADVALHLSSIGNQVKWLSTVAFVIAAIVGIYRAVKARSSAPLQ